jgi:WD40 repeat protein
VLTYINEERSEVISKLICHTQDGYGLSWNPKFYSVLASGHSDKRICIWDVEKNKQENNKNTPVMEILHHSAPVEDVAWHKMHPNIFASCSDDRLIMVWDYRFRNSINGNRKPIFEVIAHTNEVYTLDFSPFS